MSINYEEATERLRTLFDAGQNHIDYHLVEAELANLSDEDNSINNYLTEQIGQIIAELAKDYPLSAIPGLAEDFVQTAITIRNISYLVGRESLRVEFENFPYRSD